MHNLGQNPKGYGNEKKTNNWLFILLSGTFLGNRTLNQSKGENSQKSVTMKKNRLFGVFLNETKTTLTPY